VSSDAYDRLLDLIADNPAQKEEELVEMATEEGYAANEARGWLQDALEEEDVIEFDGKHWIVRKGRFAYDEYDHPV